MTQAAELAQLGTVTTVDASGDVGIGVASPNSFGTFRYLHVRGTSTATGGVFYTDTSDASSIGQFYSAGSNVGIGSLTAHPLTFITNSAERARFDTSGNFLMTNAAGLGYGTGSGGTVTQATSKTTTVTLNKPTGQITMNNASLAGGASAAFVFSNTFITSTDTLIVNVGSNGFSGIYACSVLYCVAGGAGIRITNTSGTSDANAVVINFAVIKGATA